MAGNLQLPQEAARLWGDPATRQRIVEMHAAGTSLLEMVDALNLTAALENDGLRAVIENLSPAEVTLIREAFVAEAAEVGNRSGASFPIDCRVDDPGSKVRVSADPASRHAVTPVARIEPA